MADQAVGLNPYSRVSEELGLALVSAAENMSYQNASNHLTDGEISRETVMHKIRESSAVKPPIPEENVVSKLCTSMRMKRISRWQAAWSKATSSWSFPFILSLFMVYSIRIVSSGTVETAPLCHLCREGDSA